MPIPHISPTANATLASELDHAINSKTKPLGSLGMLETLARQIGLIQQSTQLDLRQPAI
ncbi:nicotinate-nucleotide--dimethylbenzimidazole phosphoribosyltransferase, partial [Pseudomonas aeruginosa]|uniref:nicotinate-nucleotide--dimethylbenzimidazole phosphoribosyltransferase n=1 Tax=Pseudomonas aeruginosa TaxID=287 RepID=UPI003891EFA6